MAAEILQRSYRSYSLRCRRSFGIILFHRFFFFAARCIQTLVRRIQSTGRVKLRLVNEMMREDARSERERVAVEVVARQEGLYARQYMKSRPGELHKAFIEMQIRLEHTHEAAQQPEEFLSREASICFDVLDFNGNSRISLGDLDISLRQLFIILPVKTLRRLASAISPQFTEGIDCASFCQWYSSSDDDSSDMREVQVGTIKQRIRSRLALLESRGQLTALRADRRLTRMLVARATTSATLLHRRQHPPKYQCCQCLEPFVLFTDYFAHINGMDNCSVLRRRALFSRRFWLREDWRIQRECEQEVLQQNETEAIVSHRTTLEWFSKWAAVQCYPVVTTINFQAKALESRLTGTNAESESTAAVESSTENLCELFDLCGEDVEMRGLFTYYLIDAIAGRSTDRLSTDDHLDNREEVKAFILKSATQYKPASEGESGMMGRATSTLPPSTLRGILDTQRREHLRSRLSRIYVKLLWLLYTTTTEKALHFAVHRNRFPRM
jgi:hypothetical protein